MDCDTHIAILTTLVMTVWNGCLHNSAAGTLLLFLQTGQATCSEPGQCLQPRPRGIDQHGIAEPDELACLQGVQLCA